MFGSFPLIASGPGRGRVASPARALPLLGTEVEDRLDGMTAILAYIGVPVAETGPQRLFPVTVSNVLHWIDMSPAA